MVADIPENIRIGIKSVLVCLCARKKGLKMHLAGACVPSRFFSLQ